MSGDSLQVYVAEPGTQVLFMGVGVRVGLGSGSLEPLESAVLKKGTPLIMQVISCRDIPVLAPKTILLTGHGPGQIATRGGVRVVRAPFPHTPPPASPPPWRPKYFKGSTAQFSA